MFLILHLIIFFLIKPGASRPVASNNTTEFWDCGEIELWDNFQDETQTFYCSDKQSIVLHASKFGESRNVVDPKQEYKWVQLKFGKINSTNVVTTPLSSCVSAVHGEASAKSLVQVESFSLSATGGATFGLFAGSWMNASFKLYSGIMGAIDRQMEYSCNAAPGETVQIFAATTEYLLHNWKLRPIMVDEDSVQFGNWSVLPDFSHRDESVHVACVTEPSLLRCNDL